MKTLTERKNESLRLLSKYCNYIPVIVNKYTLNDGLELDKNKFLVPIDLTFGQFVYVIRKRINISANKALFVYLSNNKIPNSSDIMSHIYDENKDEDGFLYCKYGTENTFG